jgi:serine/threonine protein kinase/CRP-like cAMP-binding protein
MIHQVKVVSTKTIQWGCAAASGLLLTLYNSHHDDTTTEDMTTTTTTSTTSTTSPTSTTSITTSNISHNPLFMLIRNSLTPTNKQHSVACTPGLFYGGGPRGKRSRKIRSDLAPLYPTYTVGRVIGTGGFGSVRHGYHTDTNRPVALKFLLKKETTRSELDVEVELQRAVHAYVGVNNVLDVVETSKEWVVVMEYLSGGELFDKLIASGAYSEREASKALRTVCGTIAHLHSRGIVHGDIKPENIMINSCAGDAADLELIDFGMAFRLHHDDKEEDNNSRNTEYSSFASSSSSSSSTTLATDSSAPTTSTTTGTKIAPVPRLPIDLLIRKREKKRQRRMTNAHRLGTTAYAPPEVLQANPVGEGVDMWALGVIMYILLTGTHPFDLANDATDEEIEHNIVGSNLRFDDPVWEDVSPSAIELIRLLLSPDPHDRPSAEDAMEHPWLAEDAYERLSAEPLTEVAENLLKYQRGRTYLRASVLAVLLGIADETPKVEKRISDEDEYVIVDPFINDSRQEHMMISGSSSSTSSSSNVDATNRAFPLGHNNNDNLLQQSIHNHVIDERSSTLNAKDNNLLQRTTTRKSRQGAVVQNDPRNGVKPRKFHSTTATGHQRHRGGAYASSPLLHRRSIRYSTDGPKKRIEKEVYGRLRLFDRDNKGFISHNDLRLVTSELGEQLTDQELSDMAKVATGANKESETNTLPTSTGNSSSNSSSSGNAIGENTESVGSSTRNNRNSDGSTRNRNNDRGSNGNSNGNGKANSNSNSNSNSNNCEGQAGDGTGNTTSPESTSEHHQHHPPALAHRDIQRVLTSLRTQRFASGELIFREGEVERIFHLLVAGKVQMSAKNSQGKEVIVNHVLPGEHFGAWELMHSDVKAKPRRKTGRCVAKDGCEVLTLPQSDFKVLTETFGNVRERMHGQLRLRTREMLRHYLKEEVADYKEEVYEAGQLVYAQGEECDALFLVLEGEVEVTRESADEAKHQRSVVVEQLGAGDFFPLGVLGIGTFRKSTRGATVRARVHTRVARVNGHEFRTFQDKHRTSSDETHEKHVVDDLHNDVIERHEKRAVRAGYDAKLVNDYGVEEKAVISVEKKQ